MPQITFRGKTYNSEFEMPQDIRRAYQDDQLKKAVTKSLTDVIDIPVELQDAYRRALSKEKTSTFSPSTNKLPTIEELYRRPAPQDMTHPFSDENFFHPSSPIIDPDHSNVEPESSHRIFRVVSVILWVLFAVILIYLVTQWFW